MAEPQQQTAVRPTPDAARSVSAETSAAPQTLKAQGYADGRRAMSPAGQSGYAAKPPASDTASGDVDPRVAAVEGVVAAGNLAKSGDPLDLDGNAWRFRYADPAVQECLAYLITDWAGASDLEAELCTPFGQEPPWVRALDYKVLQAAEKPGVENRTAAVARALCATARKVDPIKDINDPRLSQIHRDVHAQAQKRMGTSHGIPLSKEEKAKGRVDLFENKGNADGRVSKGGGTSCGLLPGTVMKAAGISASLKGGKGQTAILTGPGVKGLRDEALKLGAWRTADKGSLPPPGAPYMLTSDAACEAVEHVGVISELDVPDATHGMVWKTLDAGQGGDGYAAMPVTRKVERRADGVWLINTLPGQLGDPSKWRKLAGWVDLDAVVAIQEQQKTGARR